MKKLGEVLSSFDVIVCYLYGSVVRKQQTPLSDIDLAILMGRGSSAVERGRKSLKITNAIANILDAQEIDVRVLNDSPLEHRYNVIKEGRVIYSNDERERIEFESITLMEYFDFRPIIDQYNQYMYQRIEGTGKI